VGVLTGTCSFARTTTRLNFLRRFLGLNLGARTVDQRARTQRLGTSHTIIRSCACCSHGNRNPDLLEPHLLRSLLNVRAVSVHTSCNGCHFVVIDIHGNAWLFGRNGSSCLGVTGKDHISENEPRMINPVDLGSPAGTKFVHAACGRNHTLLVASDGNVWTAGVNIVGQVRVNFCSLFIDVNSNVSAVIMFPLKSPSLLKCPLRMGARRSTLFRRRLVSPFHLS